VSVRTAGGRWGIRGQGRGVSEATNKFEFFASLNSMGPFKTFWNEKS
jgi:hypothetical protein